MKNEDELVELLRVHLGDLEGLTEKRMMGGRCFMLRGHMVGGAGCNEAGDSRLMMRVGKPNAEQAEELPGGEPLIKGGRRMGGMYLVDPRQPDEVIEAWVSLAVGHAQSLPPK